MSAGFLPLADVATQAKSYVIEKSFSGWTNPSFAEDTALERSWTVARWSVMKLEV